MKKIILIVTIFFLTACGTKYEVINANEAKEMIENGAILIDVRNNEEYIDNHIEGAINVPLEQIELINYSKDERIILYCTTGIKSSEAAKILVDNGYTNIYSLDGGLINWGFEGE